MKFGEIHKIHKSNINCLYLSQKKVVRLVCNVNYRYHSNGLFNELLGILKLFDMIDLMTAVIVYKAKQIFYLEISKGGLM